MAEESARTDGSSGCPVAGIALNSLPMVASLATACRETMSQWADYIAQKVTSDRVGATTARNLAIRILMAFEGALILARVYQSPESFRIAGV